ncbi:hypothetical protein HK097_000080 [Rhizophlyctis rosea]|uniref:F-box domain-containing protein n=1 Tax=Rhizophlyctis rosea TaxID=64517 RepID=A0AAD5SMU9_9FUNG|nr:hypothetical protein HK097_000080 [Rhizophlyctis rosea]
MAASPVQSALQNADILHLIFTHFTHPFHLLTASTVNHQWHTVTQSNILWLHLAHKMKLMADYTCACSPPCTRNSFHTQQSNLTTPTSAKTFVKHWFPAVCNICLWNNFEWFRTYKDPNVLRINPNSFGSIDYQPCLHRYEGYWVRVICTDCHNFVFHRRLVGRMNDMMGRFGFGDGDGWRFYAVRYLDPGWREGDACSEIVDVEEAENVLEERQGGGVSVV